MLLGSVAVMSVDLGSEWMKMAIVKPGVPMEIVLNKWVFFTLPLTNALLLGLASTLCDNVYCSHIRSADLKVPTCTGSWMQPESGDISLVTLGGRAKTNLLVEWLRATKEGSRNFHLLDCRRYGRQQLNIKKSLGNCHFSFAVQLDETWIQTTQVIWRRFRQ